MTSVSPGSKFLSAPKRKHFKMKYLKTSVLLIQILVSLIALAFSEKVIIKPYCMKQVNENEAPKCELFLRYEGSLELFNATCIEENVFRVPFNRSRPSAFYTTNDLRIFEEKFENGYVPPYAVIACKFRSPMEFVHKGQGVLDFFTVRRGQWGSNHTMTAAFLLHPDSTGRFVFSGLNDTAFQTSIFIFAESQNGPRMVGRTRKSIPTKLSDGAAIIPCIASDFAANVTIFKPLNGIWTELGQDKIDNYNSQNGFTLKHPTAGDYRCCATNESSNMDCVNFKLNLENEDRSANTSTINIEIINGVAVCYDSELREDLRLVNTMVYNPNEANIMEICLQRNGEHCGKHEHLKREGIKLTDRTCPNNATGCIWILKPHPYGLLYCGTSDNDNFQSLTYFTGLDGRIYTNTSGLPGNVIIKPILKHNPGTYGISGTQYLECKTSTFPLVNNPHFIYVKYRTNGSTHLLREITDAAATTLYDIDEVTCSDSLWENNKRVNSTLPVRDLARGCNNHQFECSSGKCTPASYHCDGDNDCGDFSDEIDCPTHHCERGGFHCTNTTCISYRKKCNNVKNCDNGADETEEACANVYCSSTEFRCATGQCTSIRNRCDGSTDCLDGSDEHNCTGFVRASLVLSPCTSSQFQCADGKCISQNFICDGDFDCGLPDLSDEQNCSSHYCRFGGFECLNSTSTDRTCIQSSKKCNNVYDCPDQSDEIFATCSTNTCSSYQFKCTSGQCVSSSSRCDGVNNCLDKSDETTCTELYPQFIPSETEVTFGVNVINELICEIKNITRFMPVISWWRRGNNLSETEPSRVWYDGTGLQHIIRFPKNISFADGGEYVCIAANKLFKATQVFTVSIDMLLTTATTPPIISSSQEPPCSAPEIDRKEDLYESTSNHVKEGECHTFIEMVGALFLVSILVVAVLGLSYWGLKRYKTKRRQANGIVRMRNSGEVDIDSMR